MVYHFTKGPNGSNKDGSRVPGIFQWPSPRNLMQISNSIVTTGGGTVNPDYYYQMPIVLGKWYEIEISETKEGQNVSTIQNRITNKLRFCFLRVAT